MDRHFKRIYTQVIKNNKPIRVENLSWAFPQETYKLYICSEKAKNIDCYAPDIWVPPDDALNYIEEVYLLTPGKITRLSET